MHKSSNFDKSISYESNYVISKYLIIMLMIYFRRTTKDTIIHVLEYTTTT